MSACTSRNGDKAISAFVDGFFGKFIVDDIMQYDAAIGMNRFVQFDACTQRGNDDGHFILHTQSQIFFQAVVGAVHDLIDRKRRRRIVWVGFVVGL